MLSRRAGLLSFLSAASCALLPAQRPVATADSAAIVALFARLDSTWNVRDARAFAGVFAEDGDLAFPVSNLHFHGRQGIETQYVQQLAATPSGVRHVATMLGLRALSRDLIFADGMARIDDVRGDSTRTIRRFRGNVVVQRTSEGWRFLAFRAYQLPDSARVGAGPR